MDFSRFFIDRPIFAAVLSIVIFAAGLISIPLLPIGEYPEVVPPSVVVRTVYPGANPKVIAETVATPLEEAINGVEDMMYIKSVAGSDGVLQLTVTFKPGTDADEAAVRVQNRVAQAQARLPEDVRRQGVTTQKQSPVFLMVVHLVSKDGKYDSLYLRNYMRLHVKDELAKIAGVGDAQLFGGGDYAMRLWLDPDKVASRGMTASDVLRAVREQNVQVSAGQLGAEPMPGGSDFLLPINAKGRLESVEEFGAIVLKSGNDGEIVRLSGVQDAVDKAGEGSMLAQMAARYRKADETFDLFMLLGIALIGFAMRRHDVPLAPLMIGMVLGPLAETSMRDALLKSDGDYSVFVQGWIPQVIYIVLLIVLAFVVRSKVRSRTSLDT